MNVQKSVAVLCFLILLSPASFSQRVNPTIDSLIHLVTPESYRIHFDSLRTHKGCFRKVTEADKQSSDHDACRDYIYRTLKKYLGKGNVYFHHFEVGYNKGLTNILAYKEGKTPSNGILILSAHYDSNNNREPGDIEAVCSPGANDNGSGVAAILEIARVLSGVETDNSILFAAWDLEEQFPNGFAGGSNNWFLDHIDQKNKICFSDFESGGKINIERVIANINFDMFGHPNDTINGRPVLWACSGNKIHSNFVDEYVSVFNRYIPNVTALNHGKLIYSDHFTFAARKIPSVENLESGYDKDPFYHTCSDNLENIKNINFNFAAEVTRGGMAFALWKAGIILKFDKSSHFDSSMIHLFELPDAYFLELPEDDFSAIIIDQFGNHIKAFERGGIVFFNPSVSSLCRLYIYNSKDRISRNIYLQKKGEHLSSFF